MLYNGYNNNISTLISAWGPWDFVLDTSRKIRHPPFFYWWPPLLSTPALIKHFKYPFFCYFSETLFPLLNKGNRIPLWLSLKTISWYCFLEVKMSFIGTLFSNYCGLYIVGNVIFNASLFINYIEIYRIHCCVSPWSTPSWNSNQKADVANHSKFQKVGIKKCNGWWKYV